MEISQIETNLTDTRVELIEHQEKTQKFKEYRKILNRDNVLVSKSQGYDEFYILPGPQKFEMNTELEIEVGANKAALKRAFGKMRNGKIVNRPLLNKFVKMVA